MKNATIVTSEITILAAAVGMDEAQVALEIAESIEARTGESSTSVMAKLNEGTPINPEVLARFMWKQGLELVDPRNTAFTAAGYKAMFEADCLPTNCLVKTPSGIAAVADGGLIVTLNSDFEIDYYPMCGYWAAGETDTDYWVRRMNRLVTERA